MIPASLLEKQLSEEKAARLRAERERDEARAMNVAGSADAGRLREAFVSQADILAAAQKRIEGLEAALRLEVKSRGKMHIRGCYGTRNSKPGCIVCESLAATNAALSSPAVTAEGKKLGEEEGGT